MEWTWKWTCTLPVRVARSCPAQPLLCCSGCRRHRERLRPDASCGSQAPLALVVTGSFPCRTLCFTLGTQTLQCPPHKQRSKPCFILTASFVAFECEHARVHLGGTGDTYWGPAPGFCSSLLPTNTAAALGAQAFKTPGSRVLSIQPFLGLLLCAPRSVPASQGKAQDLGPRTGHQRREHNDLSVRRV